MVCHSWSLLSYRDDETPTLHEQLPQMEMMKLPRLDNAAIAELSAAMLGNGRAYTTSR